MKAFAFMSAMWFLSMNHVVIAILVIGGILLGAFDE